MTRRVVGRAYLRSLAGKAMIEGSRITCLVGKVILEPFSFFAYIDDLSESKDLGAF